MADGGEAPAVPLFLLLTSPCRASFQPRSPHQTHLSHLTDSDTRFHERIREVWLEEKQACKRIKAHTPPNKLSKGSTTFTAHSAAWEKPALAFSLAALPRSLCWNQTLLYRTSQLSSLRGETRQAQERRSLPNCSQAPQ